VKARSLTRRILVRFLVYGGAVSLFVFLSWFFMIRMPGKSWNRPLPVPDERTAVYFREVQRDVALLGGEIGERNVLRRPEALRRTAVFLEESLAAAGYRVERQEFEVRDETAANLSVEIRGSRAPDRIVVVGAHYDSVAGSPGANDNGTGVAGVLALARAFRDSKPHRTLRFALFSCEEPPHFQTSEMGSLVYAKACRERGEDVVAMLALETMGFFSETEGTQDYPFPLSPFYPSKGNFIGFVGNLGSRSLVRRTIRVFRERAEFPSEGAALPGWMPGVGWSDHWGFWKAGYDAVMVTDTAPFRYPHYHRATDTPDKVDFDRLARVVAGLEHVVRDLVTMKPEEE